MNVTEQFYGIELPSKLHPGVFHLAIGGPGPSPLLYYEHKSAVAAKNEFVAHDFKRARVVKVTATFQWQHDRRA